MRATKDNAFDEIRDRKILETKAEHLLTVLANGTVSTNVFLRRLHNFVMDMNWLPWPIIPHKQWPAIKFSPKRAITAEEHKRIIEIECHPERRAYYEMLWHLGGSQSDVASLVAEDIDWKEQSIVYHRKKTKSTAILHFSKAVTTILQSLPSARHTLARLARPHW